MHLDEQQPLAGTSTDVGIIVRERVVERVVQDVVAANVALLLPGIVSAN